MWKELQRPGYIPYAAGLCQWGKNQIICLMLMQRTQSWTLVDQILSPHLPFLFWGVGCYVPSNWFFVFFVYYFRDCSHDFIMLPPDFIYYVYCLVCSAFIAKHCTQPWLTLLTLKSLQLLPKLDIMTVWYSKSMMGDSTGYCSGTKEAE